MRALKENTLVKFIFFIAIGLATFAVASCVSKPIAGNGRLLASSDQVFVFDQNPQCLEGTKLESFDTQIDINQCLKDYIHDKTEHGVRRNYYCAHGRKSHERHLRKNMYPKKLFMDQLVQYWVRTSDPDIFVVIGTNASFYYLQGVVDSDNKVSANEMKEAIKSVVGLHDSVISLNRCECEVDQKKQQESMEECASKLGKNPRLEIKEAVLQPLVDSSSQPKVAN